MLRTYATPLEIELRDSRFLFLFILTVTMLALISMLFAPLALELKALASLLIIAAAYRAYTQSRQTRRLLWGRDNHWSIQTRHGECDARLLPGSYVSPSLSILCFRTRSNRCLAIVICRDAVHADAFRRLRVRLKTQAEKLFASTSDPD